MFAVIGLRRRTPERWVNVVALVLAGVVLLATFVLPMLSLFIGLGMFGEVAPEAVAETFWFYWVGSTCSWGE
ncbi:MAG: hypothetical protein EAS51_00065 [Microbacteriaceae bacterium]|nr:MAG: hypothetical protein EAS51_00065 [Microbacteriaceae bacterium]